MLGSLFNVAKTSVSAVGSFATGAMNMVGSIAISIGIKPIRHFIDSNFREKVAPVAGSVVYCDLLGGAEHSGIYVENGEISNIVVNNLLTADSSVRLSDYQDFSSKSLYGTKIYVSCDKHGAVGSDPVANKAHSHVGEKNFYGLLFNNCHDFSTRCLQASTSTPTRWERAKNRFFSTFDLEWEPTIRRLKQESRNKIGATKWRLWDLQQDGQQEPEPDWNAQQDFFKQHALTPEFIQQLRLQSDDTLDYLDEISDENIPPNIVQKLKTFQATLQKVSDKYDEMAEFLALCPDAGFNYEQLESLQRQGTDFISLAKQLQHNQAIKDLAKKMGRNYIAEEKKRQIKIPQASKSEVHGTHRSDDLMRLLPSELANLEDEDLEMLFYAKLLEKNLITYQLSGITNVTQDESYQQPKTTGPVVACLDTSGSMGGEPINKAKALLFAIANILKQEKRSLYVILFGSSGQLKEYRLDGAEDLAGLLHFLEQGFDGGTDFKTPLQRSMQIIGSQDTYIKADILMLSDGDCQLSSGFAQKFQSQKQKLDCMVYSVLCNGQRVSDNFSDEVTVL